MTQFSRTVLFSLLLAAGNFAHAATVVPLNDTGQSKCYTYAPVGLGVNVTEVNCAASGADDGRYGRDAASTAGQVTKIGAGTHGFDFTKIANNGSVLPASAALGSAPTDWACTKDNVTGLTWEVKTTSGWRSSAHTFAWYSSDFTSNGGNVGDLGPDGYNANCGGYFSGYSNHCNTANYAAAANVAGMCGYSDWRLPSRRELHSLVDFSVPAPSIDANYFPNTQASSYWTANSYASGGTDAWYVNFNGGEFYLRTIGKADGNYVRLVRGGQ